MCCKERDQQIFNKPNETSKKGYGLVGRRVWPSVLGMKDGTERKRGGAFEDECKTMSKRDGVGSDRFYHTRKLLAALCCTTLKIPHHKVSNHVHCNFALHVKWSYFLKLLFNWTSQIKGRSNLNQ